MATNEGHTQALGTSSEKGHTQPEKRVPLSVAPVDEAHARPAPRSTRLAIGPLPAGRWTPPTRYLSSLASVRLPERVPSLASRSTDLLSPRALAVLVLLAAAVQQMLPSPPVTCIGIDLGTTFSCVAVFEDGEIVVIPNRAGQSITPSVVFVPASNGSHAVEPFVGDSARPTAAEMPGTLLYDGKRFIGKQYDGARVLTESVGLPFDLTPEFSTTRQQLEARLKLTMGGQPLTFAGEHIGSMIVRELRQQAEAYVGRDIHKAVLAVPVGFNRKQINATREAAELAGLEVLRMIHEPTAAAMAYGLHTHADVSIVMVYDMGGGTLDVSLLYLNNGIFEVMAAAGDNRLGGQDFNLALLQHLVREVQRRLPEAEVEGDAEVMRVLREEAGCDLP